MLTFNILTLFPDFFQSPLQAGLLGKAIKNGLIACNLVNPRQFAHDRHKHVDDRPFGGGPGMVMQLQPILESLESIAQPGKILLMSPAGHELTGELAATLADDSAITIICGRYEGIDARLEKLVNLEEIRVGRAILNGGETAALAIMEAVCRFVPGFLGKEESLREESFSAGLLEYPHYTRPLSYCGLTVPEILTSGHHAKIARWRRDMALCNTLEKEPESLAACQLDQEDINALAKKSRLRPGRNLSFCLFHYPVWLDDKKIGCSSLTNLDIHDIARISHSYGMGPFFVLTSNETQLDLLQQLLNHWLCGLGGKTNKDRKAALEKVIAVASLEELQKRVMDYYGRQARFLLTSAKAHKREMPLNIRAAREILESEPVVICLGTARGLAFRQLNFDYSILRPIRFLDENHLPVRAAAAILADRIIGDYY